MSAKTAAFRLDRHTEIGELARNFRQILKYSRVPLAGLLAVETIYLSTQGRPGAFAFGMIALGTWIPLEIWRTKGVGLPLLPMLLLQNLALYGLPIVLNHETILTYTPEEINSAGIELLLFGAALGGAWLMGMQLFSPSKPISYALPEVNRDGLRGLGRLGFSLIIGASVYLALQNLGILNFIMEMLPSGLDPIFVAVYSACGICGFFLVAMAIGSGGMNAKQQMLFWALLALNSLISASSLLLSGPAILLFSVAIGLFWGSGRVPWRYMLVIALALSFLNVGKFAMRERHWHRDEDDTSQPSVGLLDMPAHYAEWAQSSIDVIAGSGSKTTLGWAGQPVKNADKQQTLVDRLDNLQNLLFVIHTIDAYHVEPLHGRTYTLIPALLIPRVLWPDKPRSHEGQVLLNVHFGRQDLASTNSTYVAWGLLPEAEGNFGPFAGALIVGAVIGLAFSWLEKVTARKLVVSVEGFIAFDILLSLLNSYEMVASVLVTSTFQSIVPIVCACAPFARRLNLGRRRQEPILESSEDAGQDTT